MVAKIESEMVEIVFFRADGFYLVACPRRIGQELADVAKENALCNAGTLRVEDVNGKLLWKAPAAFPALK